jgi:VTC domain-containing protein
MLQPAMIHSSSLAAAGDGLAPAFELKFLLDETRAREIEAWARQRFTPDAHGDPDLGGAYRTTSLYCDTPQLDVYHRSRSYKGRKYRVRRYGAAPWVFLERKSKWGDRVAKQRTLVPDTDVALLAQPMSLVTWPGHEFHRRLQLRRLAPACQIAYERSAYVGAGPDGPLRLTLDRRLRGALAAAWTAPGIDGGVSLLAGQVILELKFRAALPGPFKALVADLRLSPQPVSKYRLCREALHA